MQLIKKIMVAVDQSEYSLALVEYAHRLAMAVDAGIILVNVYNRRDIIAIQSAVNAYDPKLSDVIIKENIAQRSKDLDDLVTKAGIQDRVTNRIVRVGVPYQELLEVIETEKPDLLIIGTKGRSNLADTIVGSCAQKMYRRCPIPVLSLRPQAKE